jgi:putative ABC transport system substrate-binding protein
VIAAPGGLAVAPSAKAASSTIPVVFIVSDDPVRLGLVASLARPGGNLTGVNFVTTELVAKRLELLRELVPVATRIAVLVNPADAANTEPTLKDVDAASSCHSSAPRRRLRFLGRSLRTPSRRDARSPRARWNALS